MKFITNFELDITEALSLRSLQYSWTKISEIVGVSRSTLHRRFKEAGITTNDNKLDDTIRTIKCDFPRDGEVMRSHLLCKEIKVPHQRLRDHDNTVAHRSSVVKYSVSVRHLDSHHKLIKWRFVTHDACS